MSMVELPGGGCATESEALTALAAEAKKRGISYGSLIASTSGWEQDEIIRDYCAEKRRSGGTGGTGGKSEHTNTYKQVRRM